MKKNDQSLQAAHYLRLEITRLEEELDHLQHSRFYNLLGSYLHFWDSLPRDYRRRSLATQVKILRQQLQHMRQNPFYRAWFYGLVIRYRLAQIFAMLNLDLHLVAKIWHSLRDHGLKQTVARVRHKLSQPHSDQLPDLYQQWWRTHYPAPYTLAEQQELSQKWSHQPLISILTPTYNTRISFLEECVHSVIAQSYDHWELILVDDCSTAEITKSKLRELGQLDDRIKVVWLDQNQGIATATNQALNVASGEFVALLDHDDVLWPDALFNIVATLQNQPDLDWIYTDEEKIDETSQRHYEPFFKPDWSPDLLYSFMYTGHLSVYRTTLVKKVGGFDSKYDLSQDYDLALKIAELTPKIYHLPCVTYSWRVHAISQAGGGKPHARCSNLQALQDHFGRRGIAGQVIEYPYANKFKYQITNQELVSIIIPSDNPHHIHSLLTQLKAVTRYPKLEIIVVTRPDVIKQCNQTLTTVKYVAYTKPYSFSGKCNAGAQQARGEFLIILNDDIVIEQRDWIERLIEFFQRPEVGAVSPKLVYEDRTVQYAGMVTAVRGLFGTAFHRAPEMSYEYFNFVQSTRNVSILCGACFAMRADLYRRLGGFNENDTPIYHSDIDLSFRIRDLGLFIVYTPFVCLLHKGHQSLGQLEQTRVIDYPDLFMLSRWGKYVSYDPYYPPHMRGYLYGHGWRDYAIYATDEKLKQKKILLVSHEASLTGAPLLVLWLARSLQKSGYSPYVLITQHGPLVDSLRAAQITTIVDAELMEFTRQETKIFFRNFDLIVANTINMWHVVLAAKDLTVPVLFYIHEAQYGIDKLKLEPLVKSALEGASKVLFPNEDIKQRYQQWVPRMKASAIATGILMEKGGCTPSYQGDKYHIVHVGSIEKRKGQDLLVKAVKSMPKTDQDRIVLHFIGQTIDYDYLVNLEGLARGLHYHIYGGVGRPDVEAMIKSASLLVCSSRDETGPLTVLEALLLRTPVIAAQVGFVEKYFHQKQTGLTFTPEDWSALARHIKYAIEHPQDMQIMAERGWKKYHQQVSWKRYWHEFQQTLEAVLDKKD